MLGSKQAGTGRVTLAGADPGHVPFHRRRWALAGRLAGALLAVALSAAAPPATAQQEHYQGTHFTPQISVSASTTRAAANPDIDITVTKTPNHCPDQTYEPWDYSVCTADEVYLEQDFKDMTVDLPAGVLGDINAVPQCDLRGMAKTELFGMWDPGNGVTGLLCDLSSQIGVVTIGYPYGCQWNSGSYTCADFGYGGLIYALGGLIFNGVPESGEQAHLYALVGTCMYYVGYPDVCDPRNGLSGSGVSRLVQLVDVGVKLRTDSDWGIEATARDLPDAVCPWGTGCSNGTYVAAPLDDFTMTLFGKPGGEGARPFTFNPTSCQARDVGASFRGYAQNAWTENEWGTIWWPGSGDGMTADSSDRYPVTECNSLPYDPQLSMELADPSPEATSAITTVLTQAEGAQTTRQVEIDIPSSFKVNFSNAVTQCAEADAAALSCPDSSQVGEVSAESTLLPESGELAGPLEGKVYIGPTTGDNITLYVILDGFVDAKLEGRIEMAANGTSKAIFELPEVPQQKITLTLFGGTDKALVKTPKTCGTHTLDASFTSHQGTEVRRDVPVEIACTGPEFDVELGTRRPRAHPTVTMSVTAPGIESASFDLSRHLKVARNTGELSALRRYGYVTLDTGDGQRQLKLKLLRSGSLGSLSLVATEGGAKVTSLGAYDADLERLSKRSLSKRTRRTRSRGATRLWIGEVPDSTAALTVELSGQRDGLIRNPSRCRSKGKRIRLGFLARVKTTDGQSYVLSRSVRMRCSKRSG